MRGCFFMNAKKTVMQYVGPNLVLYLLSLIVPPIGIIVLLFAYLPHLFCAKKYVKKLEQEGKLQEAAMELISPNAKSLMKNHVILTDHYIFCKGVGYVFSYDEVQWAYRHRLTQSVLFIPISVTDSLYLATPSLRVAGPVASMGKDKNDEIKQVLLEIYRHNNNCMIGYTAENQARYKAMRKK